LRTRPRHDGKVGPTPKIRTNFRLMIIPMAAKTGRGSVTGAASRHWRRLRPKFAALGDEKCAMADLGRRRPRGRAARMVRADRRAAGFVRSLLSNVRQPQRRPGLTGLGLWNALGAVAVPSMTNAGTGGGGGTGSAIPGPFGGAFRRQSLGRDSKRRAGFRRPT